MCCTRLLVTHSHIEGDARAVQVTVQLHIVQPGDAAIRALLAVLCADGEGGHRRGEGLGEVEAGRLYIGSSLDREWGQWVYIMMGG